MKNLQEKRFQLSTLIITSAITLGLGLTFGFYGQPFFDQFGPYLGLSKRQKSTPRWSELDEVYHQLSTNFEGPIDQDKIIEGARKGLVASLEDPYTIYMTKAEALDFQKSLNGEVGAGIGVEIGKRGEYVRVLRTLPDNPARRAGLLAGDIIYKIDDEEVVSKETETISQKLRGNPGTNVKVTIVRDRKEQHFNLTREIINNVSSDVSYDGSTAILKVTRFDKDTGTLTKKLAENFKSKGIKKIILDLRSNGGGYIESARDLLSLWIDGEKVFSQKTKYSDNVTHALHDQAILKSIPTVVLVNGSTASAAEIVAGALQDYKKATIIGEKTFGKGVVQALINLSDQSVLKVTTAHWYTPKGTNLNKNGINPDKVVEMTFEDINANRDPQLDAAKKH